MERLGKNIPSSRTRKEEFKTSNSSSTSLVEQILVDNQDVIEEGWEARHAKLIRQSGVGFYEELAHKARKFGKNPKALMGSFVNKHVVKGEKR